MDGSRTVSLTQGSITLEPNLSSDHEEVDTRLLLHAKHAATTHRRIVIQSPDTDVVELAIAHFEDLSCQELWFRTGVKDKQRFVPVHAIQHSLGQLLCKCLPSFHALTGIGKKKAWKVLIKKNQIQGDLSRLGESSSLHDPVKEIAESFICYLCVWEKLCECR